MTPPLLAATWSAFLAALAWRARPARGRLRLLAALPASSPGETTDAHPRFDVRVVVGRRLARSTRWARDEQRTRQVGGAALAALVVTPLLPFAAVPVVAVAWLAPLWTERRAARARLAAFAADLPDVVDLLLLAVGAGLTVPLAVEVVGRRAPGPLGRELARVTQEAALGRRVADALGELPARAGEAVRPLAAALVASERYGAPLLAGLERLAADVRLDRRRRAEEAARKVPVKLLFPLVTCTLPAFALLTVAPLVASAVRSLRL